MAKYGFFARTSRAALLAASSAMALTGAVTAQEAEEAEAEEERSDRIVVTGSRIARSDLTAESPVVVVTDVQVDTSGSVNLSEVLRQQIAVTDGGFNQSSVLSGGGAQSVDLRNLGADRVLTLINGRRVAKFADSLQNEAADLGFLPLAAIDRVEILRDGASAVYGADAVTGVINVILKDDFEGFELSTQAGISEHSDYFTGSIQALAGGNFDRGNVMVSMEYNYQEMVDQIERDWAFPAISGLYNAPSPFQPIVVTGSGAHPGGLVDFADGRAWCTTPKIFGGDEVTDTSGTDCPNNFYARPGLPGGVQTPLQSDTRYDYAYQQSILPAGENINITSFANYDLTPELRAFMEFQYSDRETQTNLDGNPVFAGQGSPAFPGGWVIAGDNPYNPYPGVDGQLTIRPNSTVGIRARDIDAQSLRLVAGLEGVLADRFDWELSYIHTQVNSTETVDSTINLKRAIEISDPDLCALNPLCVAALKPGSLGALDVYRPGNWSESEIAYIRQVSTSTFKQELNGINGFISGEIFDLPAGPVGLALGAEYREESLAFRPDAVTEAGESIANQTFSTFGGFDTYELFGEVNIPLLRDQPFAQMLSLNLQGRAFDYSTFGSDDVYKIGLNWEVNDQLRVRSTFGTSFRAPTLVDTFSGGTVSFDFLTDPCDASAINDNPVREANCAPGAPLGVPAGYTQAAPQLLVLAGGDSADGTIDLGPERGETFTLGFVAQPEFIPGLALTADYWSIVVTDFITSLDVQSQVLDQCFDSPNLSDPICSTFSRNAQSFALTGLTRTPLNSEEQLETAGFDWTVAYTFDLADLFGDAPGTLSLGHQGTYVTDYNLFPGVGNYGNRNGGGAIPEYRLNFDATYVLADWSFLTRARYTPEIDDINFDGRNPLNYDKIDDVWVVDAVATWEANRTMTLRAGVNNVFGAEPPYAFNTGGNYMGGVHGASPIIGRYFFARATASF